MTSAGGNARSHRASRRLNRSLLLVGLLAGCGSSTASAPDAAPGSVPDVGLVPDASNAPDVKVADAAPPTPGADFVACERSLVMGEACGANRLPCFDKPRDYFTCAITACTCVNGAVQCANAPATQAPGRQCAPEWTCYAEGMPYCNYDKPWWSCRCDPAGRWVCGDECQRLGCPSGPYPGPSDTRAHTGDPCSVPGSVCPYRLGFFNATACTCVGGRFSCTGDPPPDAGTSDAPHD